MILICNISQYTPIRWQQGTTDPAVITERGRRFSAESVRAPVRQGAVLFTQTRPVILHTGALSRVLEIHREGARVLSASNSLIQQGIRNLKL